MESDVAAIRASLTVIEWCCTVMVYAGIPFIGMFLFRMTIIARDRFNKRIIALLFGLGLASTASAQQCECSDWDACPQEGAPQNFPAYVEAVCQTATASVVQEQCTSGNEDTNTSRRIVIKWRLRQNFGVNGGGDWEAKYVFLSEGTGSSSGSGFMFWRSINGGNWKWNFNFLECTECSTCQNQCVQCKLCLIVKYLRTGQLNNWPAGLTLNQMTRLAIMLEAGVPGAAPGPGPCGSTLIDNNGDGVADDVNVDGGPGPGDADGDGDPDATDPDDDGDGIPDVDDPDDDGDGIPDTVDPDADPDGDGLPNNQDPDDDGDGVPDVNDPDGDNDGDGVPNGDDADDDGDGIPDVDDPDGDPDGDGVPNSEDEDDDGDGMPDEDPDDPDGPGDPDDPDEIAGECVDLTEMFRTVALRVLGFEGLMLEDQMEEWEQAAGGSTLRVPYLSPEAMANFDFEISYVVLSGDGTVSVPGVAPMQIPSFNSICDIVRTGLSGILVVWFVRALFDLVMGKE